MAKETFIISLKQQKSDETFNIVNIGDIVYKIKTWFSLLPRVHPYFALKCNVDRGLLATLLAFGFGFEGVSKANFSYKVCFNKISSCKDLISKQDKVDRCPISNPVIFHKCEFMKGECGWKQLQAVDFTDWERDAKIGMVLNSKYENINGQYANMISPPMVKSHEAKSIRVQISFGYNGSYTGNLYVMVMYPKYSDKLKVIDTINPQSALLGPLTITRYQIFFSPLYTDYQIVIRGVIDNTTEPYEYKKVIVQRVVIWSE
ncbi:Ornithine decarboxylase, partial [Trichoplax sp. H2]